MPDLGVTIPVGSRHGAGARATVLNFSTVARAPSPQMCTGRFSKVSLTLLCAGGAALRRS